MRPTRFGYKAIVFYAMLVCAFYAAPYLNLFFMLLAFASVLAVLNTYWTWRNIAGIRGCLLEVAPIPAGSRSAATLELHNRGRRRCHLHAAIQVDGDETRVCDHFDLAKGPAQRVEVQLPKLQRGVHRIDGIRIGTVFPFATTLAWRRLSAPASLVVYPEPADLTRYRDRNGAAGPGAIGGGASDEMGPAGLREYRPGDELRNVHWKATARRQDLVIKELEGDSCPGVEVCLDLRCADADLELALSLIMALALECQTNKELFTLHAQDHHGTYGKGHHAFGQLFAYLAAAETLDTEAAAPPTVSPSVMRLPLRDRQPHQQLRGAPR